MLWAPMVIMLVVTFTSLIQSTISLVQKLIAGNNFAFLTDGLQLIFAILLMALGIMVAVSCFGKLFGEKEEKKEVVNN